MVRQMGDVEPQPAVEASAIQCVLIVSGDLQLQQLLAATLTRTGYRVLTADTGRIALAQIVRQPVDLVVTEMVIRDMDGLTLIEKLRESTPGTRVIAMSGANNKRLLTVAEAIGARATLVKPFNRDALNAALARCQGETPS